jgi:hypothetical protein
MNYSSNYSTSTLTYVEITPSNITANIVQHGTSVITSGHLKNLTFVPGKYSIDPDSDVFNTDVCCYSENIRNFNFLLGLELYILLSIL